MRRGVRPKRIQPSCTESQKKSPERRRYEGEWGHVQGTRWEHCPTDGRYILPRLACMPNSDNDSRILSFHSMLEREQHHFLSFESSFCVCSFYFYFLGFETQVMASH